MEGKEKKTSKYTALYRRLRSEIQSGALKAGTRLPSKRAMADLQGVSVVTVEAAYRQLADEGYVEARERSGFYVQDIPARPAAAGEHGDERLELLPGDTAQDADGLFFPYSVWFRTVRSVISDYGEALVQKSPNKGCSPLRNALAEYLARYRGLHVQPGQIIIGSGSEQLYGCIVRLLGRDRVYGIEDPSYRQIEAAYAGAGAQVERLALAADGIPFDALKKSCATVLHVTPFHSYPSGVTAPAAKRFEYLRWASEGDRYIVEDDFDSEFFTPGNPLETLYSMDRSGRVIYMNTFSRSLAPAMRMGYMILPGALIERYDAVLGGYSCTVPPLEQYALAEFISRGYFEQHLNRKRRRMAKEGQ